MANAGFDNSIASPWSAIVTYQTGAESYQYRTIATNPANGEPIWTVDHGPACKTRNSDYSLVVPLDSGDIVILANAASSIQTEGFSCIQRLRASDGEALWSRTLLAEGSPFYIYALKQDANGQLLAAGRRGPRAIALRLDAENGNTLWEKDIAAVSGASSRAVAIADGANDSAVIHVYDQTQIGQGPLRLVGISTSTGSPLWSLSHCQGGPILAYQRSANELRLRMLADSSVEYVSECRENAGYTIEMGRINAQTGGVIWQRAFSPASFLFRAVIDSDGYVLLEGNFMADETAVGIGRFDPVDGRLLWSHPHVVQPPYPEPSLRNQLVLAGPYLHVLEMLENLSGYIISATLATYDVAGGTLLTRHDVALPEQGAILTSTVSLSAFGNGEVMIGALIGPNRIAGSALLEIRMNGVTGERTWSRHTPVMAAHQFKPIERGPSERRMLWSDLGGPGLVLAGHGINPESYGFPRVTKVSALDGRVLWRWEPENRVRGDVAAALTDAQGDLIVAGYNGWDDPPLLLASLSGTDGHLLWEATGAADAAALDAVLDPAGNIVLLQFSPAEESGVEVQVSRRSGSDGSMHWSTGIPESRVGFENVCEIAVDSQGSVIVLTAVGNNSTTFGMQVAKIRNADGAILWSRKLPGLSDYEMAQILVLGNRDVVVGSLSNMWRLDATTGSVEWQKTPSMTTTTIALDGQGQIVAGGAQSSLRTVARIDAADGENIWLQQLPPLIAGKAHDTISAMAFTNDGDILAAGGDDAEIRAITAIGLIDGSTLWELATSSQSGNSGVDRGYVSWMDPIGILQAPDGNIFSSDLLDFETETWTVNKVTGPFADGIFASGYE